VIDDQLDLDGITGDESETSEPTTARQPVNVATESADAPDADLLADSHAPLGPTDAVNADQPGASASVLEPTTDGNAVAEVEQLRVFFLTNRMNLNGVLSSRIIAPRESFRKYYSDLLDLCPGWVPLLTVLPPPQLIKRVVTERGAGSPVLIELAESALNGKHPDDTVVYVRAALVSDAKAIHFRDKRALREHRARGYDNVHPHDELLQVSPELFESVADDAIEIAEPESDHPVTDWLYFDRVRGAINAVLAAADSGEALAAAARVFGVKDLPEGIVIPPWLSWDGLTGAPTDPESETATELADRLVFQAAFRVLSRQDQSLSWSPSDVLEKVASEVAATRPTDEASTNVDRSLQRVRELIDVEREFEPFRNQGGSHVAAKALLLTLLRPELGQLLAWAAEETGADVTTRLVAAVLAGSLRGVARESVALRNLKLDDLTAAWAAEAANGATVTSLGSPEFVSDTSKSALLIDKIELYKSAPLAPNPVSRYQTLDADVQRLARIEVSRLLGWPVATRVHIPLDAEVQRDDSMITVTSSDVVEIEIRVDEQQFLNRLQLLTGQAVQVANEALAQSK
jgi:hypothetical protein